MEEIANPPRRVRVLAAMVAAVALSGCAAGGGNRVSYGDAQAVETLTQDWGSTDIQTVANRMVDSLVRHPVISGGARPVVQVSTLRNKTTEHIDTKMVTDKIRTALVKTGMVRFSAVSDANPQMLENLEYQQNSGVVSSRSAKGIGKQVGADFLLYGEIDSIVKKAGRVTDVYYRLTLNLVDVETGLIEWSDEKEIRKVAGKPLFGAGLPGQGTTVSVSGAVPRSPVSVDTGLHDARHGSAQLCRYRTWQRRASFKSDRDPGLG